MLEVSNVAAGYGDLTVVTDATLTVDSGQVVAVVGRNGAGKTTLLRAVAGLTQATAGSVQIGGTEVTRMPAHHRVARGIAFVQEGKRIFRERTVEENLVLGTHHRKLSRTGRRDAIGEAFDQFPVLAQRHKAAAGSLSGGQQQMLAIAQALLAKPRVLLLDEPSVGLAPTIVADVMRLLRELAAGGLAVVLVEQDVDLAAGSADDVVVMELGRTVRRLAADDASLTDVVRSIVLGTEGLPIGGPSTYIPNSTTGGASD
jgi:branched-chain amino acid transport system ATP-binding protein